MSTAAAGDARLVHPLRQPGGDVLKVGGVPRIWPCPRDLLGADSPAGAAVDAVDVGLEPDLAGTEVQMPPSAPRRVVAGRGRRPARADQTPPASAKPDHESSVGESRRLHRRTGQPKDSVECRGWPHKLINERGGLDLTFEGGPPGLPDLGRAALMIG